MSRSSAWRARLWVAVATVVGVGITSSLGAWQLGRAAMKESLAAQREARATLHPVGWVELSDQINQAGESANWAEWHDRPVRLRGRWLHEATVYLNNRPMAGRTGFIVVTPLLLEGQTTAVAVQRGWLPRRRDDRTALPALPEEQGEVEIHGRMAPPPSQLYALGEETEGRIRQNINIPAYAAHWSLRMPPVSVQQSGEDASEVPLLREWSKVGTDVHKHYGYATQWFGLSALMVFLYVWFQHIAPRRRNA